MFGEANSTFGTVPNNKGSFVCNKTATSLPFSQIAFGKPAKNAADADKSLSPQQTAQSLFATKGVESQKPSSFDGAGKSTVSGSKTTPDYDLKGLSNVNAQSKTNCLSIFGKTTSPPAFSSSLKPTFGKTKEQSSMSFFGQPAASNSGTIFEFGGPTTSSNTNTFGSPASAFIQPADKASNGTEKNCQVNKQIFNTATERCCSANPKAIENGSEGGSDNFGSSTQSNANAIFGIQPLTLTTPAFSGTQPKSKSCLSFGQPKSAYIFGTSGKTEAEDSNSKSGFRSFGQFPSNSTSVSIFGQTANEASNLTLTKCHTTNSIGINNLRKERSRKIRTNGAVRESCGFEPKTLTNEFQPHKTTKTILSTQPNANSLFGQTTSISGFGNKIASSSTSGFGTFGQTYSTTTGLSIFGKSVNEPANPGSSIAKYQPTNGIDVTKVSGRENVVNTTQHSITAMKEYKSKSFEELRMEDYLANRKGTANADVERLRRGLITQSILSAQSPKTVSAKKGIGKNRIANNDHKTGNDEFSALSSSSLLPPNNFMWGDSHLGKKSSFSSIVNPTGFRTLGQTDSLFSTTNKSGLGFFRQTVPNYTNVFSIGPNFAFDQAFNAATNPGTSIAKYQPTFYIDIIKTEPQDIWQNVKQHSITSMKEYKTKSFEELRMEDYLSHRKGMQRILRRPKSAPGTILFGKNAQLSRGLYSQPLTYSSQKKYTFEFTKAKPLDLNIRFGTTAGQHEQPDSNKPIFGLGKTPTKFFTFGTEEEKSSTGSAAGNAFEVASQVKTGFQNFNSCADNIHSLNLILNKPTTSVSDLFGTDKSKTTVCESSASKPKETFYKTLQDGTNLTFGFDTQNKKYIQTTDTSLGTLGCLSETAEQQGQLSIHEQILSKLTSPYGDNPLFNDLKHNDERDATKETLCSEEKANKQYTNNNGQQFKVFINSSPNIIKAKPIASALLRKSLFEGLEDFDDSFIFKPKKDDAIGVAASGPEIGSETNLTPTQRQLTSLTLSSNTEQDMRNDSQSREMLLTISGTQSTASCCNKELTSFIEKKVERQNQNCGTDAGKSQKDENNDSLNERIASSNRSNDGEEKSILILMFELNPFT